MRSAIPSANTALLARLILGATSAFVIAWFWFYFTDGPVASVDLPSHIALAEQYRLHWWKGRWFFYDHTTFTGYPALHFYGFLPVLCTTLLSYPLELLSIDPVRLAAHVILVLGLALLPWTFFRAIRAIGVHAVRGDIPEAPAPVIALIASLASFWFINHDHQWFGIGAAAVMNIGLFAQLFAWHFFLLSLAALCDELRGVASRLWLWWAGIIVSHLMTAVFAGALFLFAFVWHAELRRTLLRHALQGVGAAAFWLVPCAWYLGNFTAYDVYRPKGDFLELFYRYPLWGLYQSLASAWHGNFSRLEITYFLWMACTAAFFLLPRFQRSRLYIGLFVFQLLALVIFSSGFVATSIPLGLHYYRFIGFCFLLWTIILASVLCNLWIPRGMSAIGNALLVIVVLCSFVSVVRFPHYEREKIKAHRTTSYLSDQEAVLNYFTSLPDKGRVYVEYLADYSLYPPLTAHYIASNLWRRSGFESGVSSHLQESLAYRMYVVTANRLGAKTYNVPLLFIERATGDDEFLIQQLIDFGFTHVVAAREPFIKRVAPFALSEPKHFGIYTVVQIADPPIPTVTPLKKIAVGYHDALGTLPFRLVQYYFHARVGLSKLFELVDVPDVSAVPDAIPLLLVNEPATAIPSTEESKSETRVSFEYRRNYTLTHYDVHYPHNVELDTYHAVERYFDSKLKLTAQLRRLGSQVAKSELPPMPDIRRRQNGEAMEMHGLVPGKLYRINYSYFPYWRAEGGTLFRGQGERMFLLAEQPSVEMRFNPWRSIVPLLGVCITLITLIARRWVTRPIIERTVEGTL